MTVVTDYNQMPVEVLMGVYLNTGIEFPANDGRISKEEE